jgi:hypothetical protein
MEDLRRISLQSLRMLFFKNSWGVIRNTYLAILMDIAFFSKESRKN